MIRSKNEYRSGSFISHWHPTMPHIRRTAATESVSSGETDTILFTSLSFLLSMYKQTTPFCAKKSKLLQKNPFIYSNSNEFNVPRVSVAVTRVADCRCDSNSINGSIKHSARI